MKIVVEHAAYVPNTSFFVVEHADRAYRFQQDPTRPVCTGDTVILLWDDKTCRLTRPKQIHPPRA